MTDQQRAQPPPEKSVVLGWVRLLPRGDRWEVWWKCRNDVMVILAHSLNRADAEAMREALIDICKRFSNIPFEATNVRNKPVQIDEQTEEHS